MASVKIVLRQKQCKDGTYPLAIRITRDRKTSFIHLGHNIPENLWDANTQRVKKSHPNSVRLNNYLIAKLAEASDKSLELETQKRGSSAIAVKQQIKVPANRMFFGQANAYLADLKTAGKYNQYIPDKSRINHFKVFLNDQDIAFSDISSGLLDKFQVYLKGLGDKSQRTIVNNLVVIRSVFSYAAKNNVIDKKLSPFGKEGVKIKFPDSIKLGLTVEEVNRIEEVHIEDPRFDHARNLWLFAYYFAGIRIADVFRLKWSDIQDGRLYYLMGKNTKGDSLKIPAKALKVISKYECQKNANDDFVFPDLRDCPHLNDKFLLDRTIAFATSRYDKFLQKHVRVLAKIDKPLTMHIARHTFGNIAGDKIPLQMLQKLYRHSHITTTIGYQSNFIHKDTDDALEAVIGL